MRGAGPVIETRLKHLEAHLEQENPVLLTTVQSFRELDAIAYRMGLFNPEQSYATQIPWWPLISVLGTFSAGKSTFINHYLGMKLQRSGNQAVDDKFTVLCYSNQSTTHALPGQALDSDPRFPFYKISTEIEKVAVGEGSRIDAYLQLKTSASQTLRGKILIDSPGFDADAQRTSTLRITDHIIDLSDLVLVFFDARHPEPGAMRDTLDHLVSKTINRQDSGKFLYILNQLDTTAREDNPEEVVAAWQRALGERGLTAGRFYTIYNQEAANPISDEALRRRFESKRDSDLNEIHDRMEQVEIERAYRIVGSLEKAARAFEEKTVPALQSVIEKWRKRTLIGDAIVAALLVALFFGVTMQLGQWDGMKLNAPWWDAISASPMRLYFAALAAYLVWLLVHFGIRRLAASSLMGHTERLGHQRGIRGNLKEAFRTNTKPWRSIFSRHPAGWSRRSRRQIQKVLESADRYVQDLNDRFTNPSGNPVIDVAAIADDEPPLAEHELQREPRASAAD
ncbi:MAG: dynamin family protein [Gammaproteobacteria bacterium]|nr:dynamin family protein [Gammaproteobacteria bacterium]